jgi:hypothetical protein
MDKSERSWKIATILPGAVLVAVACSQIYLTQSGELTPSKGGGFGMFAVTDMRTSRMWSIDCLTDDGLPCRVLIARGEGAVGEWLEQTFRTKPDPAARAQAADRIFRLRYVPADYREAMKEAGIGEAAALLPPGWQDAPLYRLPSPGEGTAAAEPVKLRAILFQAWRLRFDPAANRLDCEPIGRPEERGRW